MRGAPSPSARGSLGTPDRSGTRGLSLGIAGDGGKDWSTLPPMRISPAPGGVGVGGEEECIASDRRFSASPLVGERSPAGAAAPSAVGSCPVYADCRGTPSPSSSPMGRRSCVSPPGGIRSDPFPSAIARSHAAPIGNLGMRTHATRHFDCTTHLHDVMRSSLLHRYLHNELCVERRRSTGRLPGEVRRGGPAVERARHGACRGQSSRLTLRQPLA